MPQLYPGRRYTRAKAPLQILRGYYPTEPGHLSVTATPKDGEEIKQGMAITLDVNGEWVKAAAAARTGLSVSVYIARQDQEDPAVQASGKLVGLDCSGSFEVLTAYINPGTFALDMELTIDDGTGFFKIAATGDKIVSRVSAVSGANGGLIPYAHVPTAADPYAANPAAVLPTASAADSLRVQFKTVAAYTKKATDI